MKLKLALAVLVGFLLGGFAGGYFGFSSGLTWGHLLLTSPVESRFYQNYMLLKLLDDGKADVARTNLTQDVQSDAILIETIAASAPPDIPANTMYQRLRRLAIASGQLPSVKADDSEIGRMAAEARTRMAKED